MSMQTHSLPHRFKLGASKHATGYWATQSDGTLVVFVHGFNGDAVNTWIDFGTLLPRRLPNTDVVFYGYDSLKKRSSIHATALRDFLTAFLKMPSATINESRPPADETYRLDVFRYSRIILVAHSLGAVTTREMLVSIYASKDQKWDWKSLVRLVLFAPAHLGADVVSLGLETLGSLPIPFIKALRPLVLMKYQVMNDVSSGSQTLSSLQERVAKARAGDPSGSGFLRARAVGHAEYEQVIVPNQFVDDEPMELFIQATHTSLCKPRVGSEQAVEMVARIVEAP